MKPDRPNRTYLRDPLQMGATIVGVTVVFGGGGWWIDSLIGTFPLFMMIGAVVGLFGYLYTAIARLREMDKRSQKKKLSADAGNGKPKS